VEEKVTLNQNEDWNKPLGRKPIRIKKSHKKLSVVSLALGLLVVGGATFVLMKKPVNNATQVSSITKTIQTTNTKPEHPDRIRLLLAGDFIAHDSINAQAKQADGTYDYMPMIADFTPIFSAADIRFCHDANLNGGAAFTISGYPKFNSPTEFVR
jgi:hypothetical protein